MLRWFLRLSPIYQNFCLCYIIGIKHGLRTPRELFWKSQTFGLGQTNWGGTESWFFPVYCLFCLIFFFKSRNPDWNEKTWYFCLIPIIVPHYGRFGDFLSKNHIRNLITDLIGKIILVFTGTYRIVFKNIFWTNNVLYDNVQTSISEEYLGARVFQERNIQKTDLKKSEIQAKNCKLLQFSKTF